MATDETDGRDQPVVITDWTTLKPGEHIRLSCNCMGFVTAVWLDGADSSQNGFMVFYTGEDCGKPGPPTKLTEDAYRQKYGPYRNFFNHSLPDQAMPATRVPPPLWWDEVAKKNGWARVQKRYPEFRPVCENCGQVKQDHLEGQKCLFGPNTYKEPV